MKMKMPVSLSMMVLGTFAAVAGPSTDHIVSLWRNAQTNEYRTIMERRLNANSMDVVGWLMKFHWDWVFDDGMETGLTEMTNTIDSLVRAAELYRGPIFAMEKGFFVSSMKVVKMGILSDGRSESLRTRAENARRNWTSSRYIHIYKGCFMKLEEDGMFEDPPRVWTDDPTLYRVAEAETNLYECATNLWMGGAVTNVARIAQRRLAVDPDDPIGLLLAADCAYAVMDTAAFSNVSARLVTVIGGMTNLMYSAESAHELPEQMRWSLLSLQKRERECADNPVARVYPKFIPGKMYHHADILEELWQKE